MQLSIRTEDYWQGTLEQVEGGREVNVRLALAYPDAFYEYVLGQFKRGDLQSLGAQSGLTSSPVSA